jgi:hypothetical protein
MEMGRINHRKKHYDILQAHKRHDKIMKLKVRYAAADPKVKEAILIKLKKISAFIALGGSPKL